jgi:hypothetical protein
VPTDQVRGSKAHGSSPATGRRLTSLVVIAAGPTASGKSALTLALAAELGGTVINADSLQCYRDLRILTAHPDAAAEARAPHRLYGILDAADPGSAGRWRAAALTEIAAAVFSGRLSWPPPTRQLSLRGEGWRRTSAKPSGSAKSASQRVRSAFAEADAVEHHRKDSL